MGVLEFVSFMCLWIVARDEVIEGLIDLDKQMAHSHASCWMISNMHVDQSTYTWPLHVAWFLTA